MQIDNLLADNTTTSGVYKKIYTDRPKHYNGQTILS